MSKFLGLGPLGGGSGGSTNVSNAQHPVSYPIIVPQNNGTSFVVLGAGSIVSNNLFTYGIDAVPTLPNATVSGGFVRIVCLRRRQDSNNLLQEWTISDEYDISSPPSVYLNNYANNPGAICVGAWAFINTASTPKTIGVDDFYDDGNIVPLIKNNYADIGGLFSIVKDNSANAFVLKGEATINTYVSTQTVYDSSVVNIGYVIGTSIPAGQNRKYQVVYNEGVLYMVANGSCNAIVLADITITNSNMTPRTRGVDSVSSVDASIQQTASPIRIELSYADLSNISPSHNELAIVQDENNYPTIYTYSSTLSNWKPLRKVPRTFVATGYVSSANLDLARYDVFVYPVQVGNISISTIHTGQYGEKFIVQLRMTSGSGTITRSSAFESSSVILPTSYNTSLLTVGFIRNQTTNKWRCIAVA